MVEVNQLRKKTIFFMILERIKQKTKQMPLKGGGLQPPQPLPWIHLCFKDIVKAKFRTEKYIAMKNDTERHFQASWQLYINSSLDT